MEPDNVLMGDSSMGIDLPQAQIDKADLAEEKKMAKYSKTAEFKRIQSYCAERILFYQTHLPDGRPVIAAQPDELGKMWLASNVIITEFNLLMNIYENAAEAVKENG